MHLTNKIIVLVLALTLPARAATITFTAAEFADATQISTNGALQEAVNMNGAETVTVNGVAFSSSAGGALSIQNQTAGSDFAKFRSNKPNRVITGVPADDADALLDFFAIGSGADSDLVTLGGLTVGNDYEFQLLIVDDRDHNANTRNRTVTVSAVDGGVDDGTGRLDHTYSTDTDRSAVRLVTGSFTADATTQSFDVSQGKIGSTSPNNALINAYQLRVLSEDPEPEPVANRLNVLLLMSDDLTSTALGCYGNTVCQTPHIDSLAAAGTRYTRAYCQYPVCGPSRASMMFGYYPHTRGMFSQSSGRAQNGDRESWTQYFKNRGYYSARVSKIFHMPVPEGIRAGNNGSDDALSWTERFNSQGPEAEDAVPLDPALNGGSPTAERLQGTAGGPSPNMAGGNTYEYVIVPDGDTNQSDYKTATKACELIGLHKDEPFFLAVGFVRPHIPMVAPKAYFDLYPWADMVPPTIPAQDDAGDVTGKYVTTDSQNFNDEEKKKSIVGYYAAVSYMDAQVGRVLQKLEDEGLADETIVIFASDHGFFLGEHNFWSKQYVHEESSRAPLIIKVPGKAPAVCHSLAELLDLFPTTVDLCGLPVPSRLQGKSLAATLDDPTATVRDAAFTVLKADTLYALRTAEYTYIQKKADGSGGYELYDMVADPYQYINLASDPAYASVLDGFKEQMRKKLLAVNDFNDDHALWLPFNDTRRLEAVRCKRDESGKPADVR